MKYLIHNDLSNVNRKRIDLIGGTKLSEVKELEKYDIQIEEQWTEGETTKIYVTLSEKAPKGSARIEFSKYEKIDMFDEVEKRFITVDITTKSNNLENAEKLLDLISAKMEELDNDIKFHKCHAELDNNSIADGFILEFYYGEAEDTKKYIKDLFKQIKKSLGIR